MGTFRTAIDITGRRFTRLVVVSRKENVRGHAAWLCTCDCGASLIVISSNLIGGKAKSCGCYRADRAATLAKGTHGLTDSAAYKTWTHMLQRCFNENHKHYVRYGGRGIVVCERWRNSFQNFLDDMGERPEGHTIERIDNNGNYKPGNCRWATMKEQGRNRSTSRFLTVDGVTRTATEWGEVTGVLPSTIFGRLSAGWDAKRAVTQPIQTKKAKQS